MPNEGPPEWASSLSFWQDKAKDILCKRLFGQTAELIAGQCGVDSVSQLRNFYDMVKGLDDRVQAQAPGDRETEFERVRPFVNLVKARAAHAGRRIPPNFRHFIDAGVGKVEDAKDLHAFCLLFEAVAGYSMPLILAKRKDKKEEGHG
jgi:CRISPR type III-A-associated protein Csm2